MKLFILLFLVSCSSFEKETLKEQNQKAVETMRPMSGQIGPNKW